jgi:glycosyltransferase involved in cell wall biosynthesis
MLGSKINPYCFVKDCDIYVQTSFHEGYCLTVHEAKIFNKPVVVTNFPNATNLIKDNQDGLIVNSTKQAIYEGVKSLLTNEELRILFQRNLVCQETINEAKKLKL